MALRLILHVTSARLLYFMKDRLLLFFACLTGLMWNILLGILFVSDQACDLCSPIPLECHLLTVRFYSKFKIFAYPEELCSLSFSRRSLFFQRIIFPMVRWRMSVKSQSFRYVVELKAVKRRNTRPRSQRVRVVCGELWVRILGLLAIETMKNQNRILAMVLNISASSEVRDQQLQLLRYVVTSASEPCIKANLRCFLNLALNVNETRCNVMLSSEEL